MSVPVNDNTTLGELKARAKFKEGDLLSHRACLPDKPVCYVVLDVMFTTDGKPVYVCRWFQSDGPSDVIMDQGIRMEHELAFFPFPANWVKDKRKEGQ